MLLRGSLLLLILLECAGCGAKKPALTQVRGVVRINGQPAERVAVGFHHTDPSMKGNAAHPCAVTDANGQFSMSTNADGDGATTGEYRVTFIWWSDPDPDKAKDLLAGVYADQIKSTIKVKVGETSNDLTPFDLKTDPAQAKKFVK